MGDLIDRQAAIEAVEALPNCYNGYSDAYDKSCIIGLLEELPSAHPERLTNDDFETIRIHLSAYKEKLCNQRRWKEAEEYQRIIDRFMSFASEQPERKKGKWVDGGMRGVYYCSECKHKIMTNVYVDQRPLWKYCPNCGSYNGGDNNEVD